MPLYSLLLLLISALTANSLPYIQIPNAKSFLPITDFISEKFGFVSINKSSSGYSVNVDFKPTDSIQDQGTQDTRMMLALYSNKNILTQGCEDFSIYDCAQYDCDTAFDKNITSATYTRFQANGYFTQANIYVDYDNFNINLNDQSVLATSCLSYNKDSAYGSGTYGVLGLGLGGSSWANYRGQKILFSIYLDQTGEHGEWIFDFDATKTSSTTVITSLPADVNWNVEPVDFIQVGSSQINPPLKTNMIFDIDMDVIGFPMAIYQEIITNLTGKLECPTGSFIKPVCSNMGNLKNLPSISISVKGVVLNLPPDVYVHNYTATADPDTVTLNIAAVDSNSTTPGMYVTGEYAHSIILGSNVMKYYYTVFNASSFPKEEYTIDLYLSAPTQPDTGSGSSKVLIIIGSIVAFVIVSLFAFCIYRRCWKKGKAPRDISSIRAINNQTDTNIRDPFIQNTIEADNSPTSFLNSLDATGMAGPNRGHTQEEERSILGKNNLRSDAPNQDSTIGDLVMNIPDKTENTLVSNLL